MEDAFNMQAGAKLASAGSIAFILAASLGGCGKIKQNDPNQSTKLRAEAKRRQVACGSSAAYDRLKSLLFDQAVGTQNADRAKLDTLADYSFARMEDPVVNGWDPALDITRCRGRFILQLPPGAKRAFDGESHLQADVDYTAQAAADGSGFVYQLKGAEPIIARLVAFNLAAGAYRPPPAIDDGEAGSAASNDTALARAEVPVAPLNDAQRPSTPALPRTVSPDDASTYPSEVAEQRRRTRFGQQTPAPVRGSQQASLQPEQPVPPLIPDGARGQSAVRAFYAALGAGNGEAASSQVVPEKRASRAFSPEAISRFYGKLAEPVRLTDIAATSPTTYRVRYRYSTGRSQCNGSAVVSVTNRSGRSLIRSIRALSGC